MFDVVITRGIVVDGSGKPGYPADVGILGGKIEAIGDLSQAETARVIDASGLTVSPGFIDSHTHSYASLLTNPQHAQGLRQGITTEILGQDGLSYAPLSADNYETYRRYLAGILGRAPAGLDMSSVAAFRSHYHNKTAINTAYLVAHGAIRLETCGFQDVPMTGDRMKHALRLVEEGLEQGAVGLATGLSYHPHSWSTTEEIVELCGPVQKAGGVYVTHLRDVHPERGFGGGGVPEAREDGRRSGVHYVEPPGRICGKRPSILEDGPERLRVERITGQRRAGRSLAAGDQLELGAQHPVHDGIGKMGGGAGPGGAGDDLPPLLGGIDAFDAWRH